MPIILSVESTACAIEPLRADPTTPAAARPAAVWLRNSRRLNCFEALFIKNTRMAALGSSFSQRLYRNLWTTGLSFEYSDRRNCPREEVRLVSLGFYL